MTSRHALLVRHPSPDAAYQALRYCRTNGARVDVFFVEGVPGGPFSAPTALRRSARQHGWRCAYRLWCSDQRGELSIDHLVPLARGGTDRLHNLRIVCAGCNQRKGGMKLQSFKLVARQRVYERLRGGRPTPIRGKPPTISGLEQDLGRVGLVELPEQIARTDHVLQANSGNSLRRPQTSARSLVALSAAGLIGFTLGALVGRASRGNGGELIGVEHRLRRAAHDL